MLPDPRRRREVLRTKETIGEDVNVVGLTSIDPETDYMLCRGVPLALYWVLIRAFLGLYIRSSVVLIACCPPNTF